MRARTFMQVSIGILALAMVYHLGASTARGQSGSVIAGPCAGAAEWATGVVGRTVYYTRNDVPGPATTIPDPVPGSSPIVSTAGTSQLFEVLLENGDVYRINVASPPWVYTGNLLGQPTPVHAATFGALKVRYR